MIPGSQASESVTAEITVCITRKGEQPCPHVLVLSRSSEPLMKTVFKEGNIQWRENNEQIRVN